MHESSIFPSLVLGSQGLQVSDDNSALVERAVFTSLCSCRQGWQRKPLGLPPKSIILSSRHSCSQSHHADLNIQMLYGKGIPVFPKKRAFPLNDLAFSKRNAGIVSIVARHVSPSRSFRFSAAPVLRVNKCPPIWKKKSFHQSCFREEIVQRCSREEDCSSRLPTDNACKVIPFNRCVANTIFIYLDLQIMIILNWIIPYGTGPVVCIFCILLELL